MRKVYCMVIASTRLKPEKPPREETVEMLKSVQVPIVPREVFPE
jgi:hypothetical protein